MTSSSQALGPPSTSVGPIGWLRHNLFGSVWSGLTTLIVGAIAVIALFLTVEWALTDARWDVVTANLKLFLIGTYPFAEAWRVWLCLVALSVLGGLSASTYGGGAVRTLVSWLAAGQAILALLAAVSGLGPVVSFALVANAGLVWLAFIIGLRVRVSRRLLAIGWLLIVPLWMLLLGGVRGSPLAEVSSNDWGGLLLTFLLAIVGIVLSFPFGVLLALGRRSDLPAVRFLSTAYIEIVRGVPLVTILFMAAIILPLFLPGDFRIDRVLRAMGGITLFSAAYVAENVRGGLQAIPSGQLEAAHAIGLNAWQTNRFIVLPQALRAVIPANVGLFISLLKDTTLVVIGVGLLEILGIGRAVLAQPSSFGAHIEVYIFIAVVFFILCYTMSQASYRLEAALGVGKR